MPPKSRMIFFGVPMSLKGAMLSTDVSSSEMPSFMYLSSSAEHLAALCAVCLQKAVFLQTAGAFATGHGGAVVGKVQNQVERVQIGGVAVGFLQHFQRQTLFFQRVEHRLFFVGAVPRLQKGIERGVLVQDIAFAVIGQAFGNQIAVFVQDLHLFA